MQEGSHAIDEASGLDLEEPRVRPATTGDEPAATISRASIVTWRLAEVVEKAKLSGGFQFQVPGFSFQVSGRSVRNTRPG